MTKYSCENPFPRPRVSCGHHHQEQERAQQLPVASMMPACCKHSVYPLVILFHVVVFHIVCHI